MHAALNPVNSPKRRMSWRRRIAIAAVGLVTTLAIAWILFGIIAAHRLESEIARVREAGEPLTWHELHGDLQTSGAGLEYEAAFELMDEITHELASVAEQVALEQDALAQALAEARHIREREPMTFEDLNNPPPPAPPELYVADQRSEASLEALAPGDLVSELLQRFATRNETHEDREAARGLLEEYDGVLAHLDTAASIDDITFDLDADIDMWAPWSALGEARAAAHLLLI